MNKWTSDISLHSVNRMLTATSYIMPRATGARTKCYAAELLTVTYCFCVTNEPFLLNRFVLTSPLKINGYTENYNSQEYY